MSARPRLAAWALAGALALPAPAGGASEVHGADAVFTGRGVVVVWAARRGEDDARSVIVIRVVARDPALRTLAVHGVDPFTRERHTHLAPTSLRPSRDVRIVRAIFAEFPRTELHLAPSAEDLAAGRATLVVWFGSVPDTTPEFPTDNGVAAYLGATVARLTGASTAR